MSIEADPTQRPTHFSRRVLLGGGFAAAAFALGGCADRSSPSPVPTHSNNPSAPASETPSPERKPTVSFLDQVGESLIQLGEVAQDGLRFRSAIQSPHYQTDRDVGASGVGMGFLVLSELEPGNPQWLQAAEKTAKWLNAVAERDGDGELSWPDYVDDTNRSADTFTSFDDGTIGIGDFYWRLYEQTNNEQYKNIALSTLHWTYNRAENIGSAERPVYRWPSKAGDASSANYMGMGQGAVGLVHTFTTYYERLKTSDPEEAAKCKKYIDGALRHIGQARAALGNNDGDSRALPETGVYGMDGDTCMNSGYLSGAAGAAFMYLKLHEVFSEDKYLKEADKLFNWLEDTKKGPMVAYNDGSVAWKLALDAQGDDDPVLATGFEEGSAGIAWTYLQAYKLTGETRYLSVAKRAADWLVGVAKQDGGGTTWHEYRSPTKDVVHANLNNGAAGIGMFLKELADVSGEEKYARYAQSTLKWLIDTAKRDKNNNPYWGDNDGDADYSQDPSWHWGTAGILAFLANMAGGNVNIPGMQEGVRKVKKK